MSDKKESLFLIDAMAMIYRAYFAFSKNPRVNSKGTNTSAVYGFTTTLFDIIKKEKPDYIGVAFDTSAPTQRHIEFVEYKANRQETPEDIRSSIPVIKELLNALNIPVFEADGYEADDIIGTISKKGEAEGLEVYMVTPDKDFGQVVSDNIFLYKPAYKGPGFNKLGKEDILKRWNIKETIQVIDILAMMGDSVDNIPGIPGVGEKTAMKLIEEYGSLENLLKNTDQLKGKLKERVEDNKELAMVCKSLATIILDTPIDFQFNDLKLTAWNEEKLKAIFTELEFRALGKRIIGETFQIGSTDPNGQFSLFGGPSVTTKTEEVTESHFKGIDDIKHSYELTDSSDKINALAKKITSLNSFCFDTETTGLDPHNSNIIGISFSFEKGKAYYVPIPEEKNKAIDILDKFKPCLENNKIEKVGQNLKFDIKQLYQYGIRVGGPLFDTMVAHYLIDPDTRHNMNVLAENYLNYRPISIESLIGKKNKNQGNMKDVPLDKMTEYACEDADITWQLKDIFKPLLKEKELDTLYNKVEAPLISVLSDMEYEGVNIDQAALSEYSKELTKAVERIQLSVFELAGIKFNIASPKQMGQVLFEKMEIKYPGKKTKTGQFSTNEETLKRIENEHEIIAQILAFRQLQKLRSTYVDALPKLVNIKTQRVHSSFNQTVAATGRLSSTSPNLQNIPIRTERGREVRKAFIPRDEKHTLLAADYSQIELRLIAEVSKDPSMTADFINGLDIHTATASRVYNVDRDKVDVDMRRNAKMVNFGIIYGISAFGLSQRLRIKRAEAKELIDNYFLKYPGIKDYMNNTIAFAKENGFVETIMGRKRYIKDIHSANATVRGYAERNAINAPIQGSAADLIKIAMINIDKEIKIKKLKSRMILQVHDELIFDTVVEELEIIKPIVKSKMSGAIKTNIPLNVELGYGKNWLNAH